MADVELELARQALQHARQMLQLAAFLILGLTSLAIFLWRRHASLTAAFFAELERHTDERCLMLKQQSHELVSLQTSMLHAFELRALPTQPDSASSPVSFGADEGKKGKPQ